MQNVRLGIGGMMVASMITLVACGDDGGERGPREDILLAEEVCTKDFGCFPENWGSLRECVAELASEMAWSEAYSTDCYQAMRAVAECLAGLETCEELGDSWDSDKPGYPCSAEEARWITCDD